MSRVFLFLSAVASVTFALWVPVGPDGGSATAIAVSPSQPTTLVAVISSTDTVLPVYRTTDTGAAWERRGLVPYVVGAVIDPFDPMTVYCPDGNDRVFHSTDGGTTWRSASVSFWTMAVGCDPFVPGRVYLAGVLYDTITIPMFAISTDHGATWSEAAVVQDTGYIYSLDASPVDSGVIYLGGDYGTVYRSTDAGLTWESRSAGLSPDNVVLTLSASHGDSGVVCAGTVYGIFRTTDAGTSWAAVGGPSYVVGVDLSPADSTKGYAYGYDTVAACYSTTDAGATWVRMSVISSSAVSGGGLVADPGLGDGAWCPTAAGVMHSTDRGATWNAANTGIRAVTITTISVPGWARERVYVAVEGVGVHKSSDAGETWERCADFLSCGNICGIGLAPGTGGDRLYAFEGAG